MTTSTSISQAERLDFLQQRLHPFYKRLAEHPLYASFRTVEDLRIFMEAHIFAVWDFMSLLKTLQRGLTCVEVPWLPSPTPESRRLVNEIVLGEESDMYEGQHVSHFELYRMAMQSGGADTSAMDTLLQLLAQGEDLHTALERCGAPAEAIAFVKGTFQIITKGSLHQTAAAFTFGREDLIPEMFKGFVRDLDQKLAGSLGIFLWYLERHIEVDGEEHGPMALRMVSDLCGDDDRKWNEAEEAARTALKERLQLWDGIHARITNA
jgi:hypothetical protein